MTITDLIDLDLLTEFATRYDGKIKTKAAILQRSTEYANNDIVHDNQVYLMCVVSGTSGSNAVDLSSLEVGDTIIDGTVTWRRININAEPVSITSSQIQALFN